jgi:malate dehydrogenase
MTRDDLFNTNASIVRDLASAVARVAPSAHILVISNPVNSTVPIVAATLEKAGVFDPHRVFGITTLDVVRARRFLGGLVEADPIDTPVTVVGGHSGPTIVPLLSQSTYGQALSGEKYEQLVHRIQFGGDEVVKAKDGAGSATLSMAYAGAKFTSYLLRALNGEKGIVTPTFVKNDLYKDQGIDFFASNVLLGVRIASGLSSYFLLKRYLQVNGVEKIQPIGPISREEEKLLEACLPELKKNIEKGKAFVADSA